MRTALVLLLLSSCDRVYGLSGRADAAPIDGDVRDGLVAWFTMDTISDVLEDSSSTALVGLCDNMRCPTPAAGRVDGALHFDGMTTIGANSKPPIETAAGFTVAVWFRIDPSAILAFSCPVNKVSANGNNSWQFCLTPGNVGLQRVNFYTDNNGTDSDLFGGEVDADRFHHVVLWWDGVEKRIYIDGLMKSSVVAPTRFTGGVLGIGADYDNGAIVGPFTGDLDDLRVYDRPLTLDEISDVFRLGG